MIMIARYRACMANGEYTMNMRRESIEGKCGDIEREIKDQQLLQLGLIVPFL
jgi:hypothetical protein